MSKVTAPNRRFNGISAGVSFADGVGETSNPGALAYFERAGYGIDKQPPAFQSGAQEAFQPALPAEVRGAESNDAAVMKDASGPVSDAFLPPINAGEAEPHGPLVVSPGLHAVPPAPILPGDVHEVPQQEIEESRLVERVLVEGEPATIVSGPDPLGEGRPAGELRAQPGVPSKSASKAEWVDHAVARGMSRDEAEDATKADLQERFGAAGPA